MRRQLFSDTDRKQSQHAGARGSGRACVSPSKALLPSDLLLSARSRLLKVLQPSRQRQRYKTGLGVHNPSLAGDDGSEQNQRRCQHARATTLQEARFVTGKRTLVLTNTMTVVW